MQYVVKVVAVNPEGAVDFTEYWVAGDEAEMKAMIECKNKLTYVGITCLGPVVKPTSWCLKALERQKRESL